MNLYPKGLRDVYARSYLPTYLPTYLSIHLFLLLPLCSIGHPWNASFHIGFLILDSRKDSLDGESVRRKAAT
jgi:hypothetical protein